jgi:hypothetical protein
MLNQHSINPQKMREAMGRREKRREDRHMKLLSEGARRPM